MQSLDGRSDAASEMFDTPCLGDGKEGERDEWEGRTRGKLKIQQTEGERPLGKAGPCIIEEGDW